MLEAPILEKFVFLKNNEDAHVLEKFNFLKHNEGHGPHEKRGWFDLLAIPDLAFRIKQWKKDGVP